jgi:thiol-disulfide isomerase/thioredoxin
LDEELDMMAARLLMMAMLGLAATGCDGGDKGKTPALQASAGVKDTAPPVNSIDRRFAGQAMPEVSVETAPGKTETLAALMAANPGKRVLVNMWATWCPPCLAEMPELDRLAADEAGGLLVVPVSQDMEGWQAVEKFFAPGKFKTLVPVLDQPGSLGERLKVKGLPVSVLYDAQGREIWRVAGVPDWNSAEVRAAING